MTTHSGRVVYQRKLHPFTDRRVLAIVTKRFESALEDGVTGVDALFALALFKAALLFTAQADNVTIPDIVLNSGIVEAGFQDTLTNLVAGTFGAT